MNDNEFGPVDLNELEPDIISDKSESVLGEIKRRWEKMNCLTKPQIDWLIAELEKSRAEVLELEERINKWRAATETADIMGMEWKDRADKAEAELKDWKRYEKAAADDLALEQAEIKHLKEQIRQLRKA